MVCVKCKEDPEMMDEDKYICGDCCELIQEQWRALVVCPKCRTNEHFSIEIEWHEQLNLPQLDCQACGIIIACSNEKGFPLTIITEMYDSQAEAFNILKPLIELNENQKYDFETTYRKKYDFNIKCWITEFSE